MTLMKKWITILSLILFFVSACGPKPAYRTAQGKKKQKYYNKVQYGIEKNPTPPKSMTKNKKVKKKKK
jgi:hypothetical protein